MAIDRDTIIKQIFNNTRKPATGWVSPVVDGYKADQCGEFCKFDPAKAKAKLAEAGGFKGGKITLSYNADASHKGWTEATCNSIKQPSVSTVSPPRSWTSPPSARRSRGCRKMKGMFRTGWQMDYPSIENFLARSSRPSASSNDGDYSNPAFDKLLVEAAAATDPAAANKKYQEAEALLANDMPAIPMWYSTATFGWSDKVTGVKITAFGTIDFVGLAEVTSARLVPGDHEVESSACQLTAGRPMACSAEGLSCPTLSAARATMLSRDTMPGAPGAPRSGGWFPRPRTGAPPAGASKN